MSSLSSPRAWVAVLALAMVVFCLGLTCGNEARAASSGPTPGPVTQKRVEAWGGNVIVYNDGGAYGIAVDAGGSGGLPVVANTTNVTVTSDGGSFGVAVADTCTSERCTIGDGGTYWDGGHSGEVQALRFVATIAGNGTTAFECRNQTAASSPCLNNPQNIMELFTTPPNKDQSNANFPDFLFLSQAPDGGRRVAGYLLGVLSGPSSAELPEWAVTHNGGIELNLSAQGGYYTQNANAAGQAADMVTPQGYWRRLGGSAGAGGPAFIDWQNVGTQVTSGDFYQWYNKAGTQIASIEFDGTWKTGVLRAPVVHGSGTVAQAMESGASAMIAGSLPVTFGTAFSAAPSCVCTHVNTTNSNPCVIGVAPSTSGVTFAVTSGSTDVVNWLCMGAK